jgi:hypothetical protein
MYKESLIVRHHHTTNGSTACSQLEALQRIVFPSLAEEELLHEAQYKKHIEIFRKGNSLHWMGIMLSAPHHPSVIIMIPEK